MKETVKSVAYFKHMTSDQQNLSDEVWLCAWLYSCKAFLT